MLCGLLSLWQPADTPVPPTPPVPPAIVEEYHAGNSPVFLGPALKISYTNYPPGYEISNVDEQNADDLEVVKVLTEFLERNG